MAYFFRAYRRIVQDAAFVLLINVGHIDANAYRAFIFDRID